MNKLISAKMQKAKQSLWIILAFIPFVNFLGFLYIGYRADRKKWTDMGKGYLILNLVSACFFWCTHTFHFRVNETIEIVSNILFAFVFVSALVLQLYASVDYLKLHRSEKSVSHELLNNRLWKTIQSSPMLLPLVGVLFYLASGTFEGVVTCSFITLFISFVFFYAANRANKRNWRKIGGIYLIYSLAAVAVTSCQLILYENTELFNTRFESTDFFIIPSINGIIITISTILAYFYFLLYRREYLEALAPVYEEERHKYACLESKRWRALNSWWLLLCVNSYGSGISLIYAGVTGKKKKVLLYGIASLTLAVGAAYARATLDTLNSFFNFIIASVHMLSVAAALLVKPGYLSARAKICGGFVSDVDKEVHFQNKLEERYADASQKALGNDNAAANINQKNTAEIQPGEEKREVFEAEKCQKGNSAVMSPQTVDINNCNKEELTKLPGITIIDAKRAIERREAQGEFGSVDEFIEYLGIKPHFAVKIFKLAKATHTPVEEEEVKKHTRRTLDI